MSPGRLWRQRAGSSTGPPPVDGSPILPGPLRSQHHGITMKSAPGGCRLSPMGSSPDCLAFPPNQQQQVCRLLAMLGTIQGSLSQGRWRAESGPALNPYLVCLLYLPRPNKPPVELGWEKRRLGMSRGKAAISIPSLLRRRGYSHSSLSVHPEMETTIQKKMGSSRHGQQGQRPRSGSRKDLQRSTHSEDGACCHV